MILFKNVMLLPTLKIVLFLLKITCRMSQIPRYGESFKKYHCFFYYLLDINDSGS